MEGVFGVHPVREVLRKGIRAARELLVARSPKDPVVKEILALARKQGVPWEFVGKDEVERRAPGGNHQGILLLAEELPILSVPEALESIAHREHSIWLGLDGITDPHNLGAILRNAAAFGAEAVVLPERRSARLTPLVQKVASGAAESVAIISETNLNQTIALLRDAGFRVFGAAVEGKPLPEVRFEGPVLLLIGAEGEGLRRRTRELAEELVAIPQVTDGVASLNASAASAVLLYGIRQRLGFPDGEA